MRNLSEQLQRLFLLIVCCQIGTTSCYGQEKFNRRTGMDKLDRMRFAALSNSQPDLPDPASFEANGAAKSLEELKQKEADLANLLASIRMEKLAVLRSRPLKVGVIGFGRFGQFISRTFAKHAKVIATSRSDYTEVAEQMGITYVPLSDPDAFLDHDLDVIVLAVSIVTFEPTIQMLLPHLQQSIFKFNKAPLIVDVLSVKEHPREIMLKQLPDRCDILCTHPMFGPDSGRDGWQNLNFVYEKTRMDGITFHPAGELQSHDSYLDQFGNYYSFDDDDSHMEAVDRVERFLSIWEEEGCRMVPLSCKAHDEYAANSQFITHLMGRILGTQGLSMTPIDTKGFTSVLNLIDSTTADSFDLFYGLYKYNKNSAGTIRCLKAAMEDVVSNLKRLEDEDKAKAAFESEEALEVEFSL